MLSKQSSLSSTPSCLDVSSSKQNKIQFYINTSLINAISETLNALIKENSNISISKSNKNYKLFNIRDIPSISLYDYIIRIGYYAEVNSSTLIIALIYIDRICDYANITLTSINVHLMYLTAVVISIKFNEDVVYSLKYYAQIGGITVRELQRLEDTFYTLINGNCYIEEKLYEKYQNYLMHYNVKN